MTREEAYTDKLISRSELINKIYDNFESRICENCKYFLVYDRSKQSGSCDNEESIAYTSQEALYGDDGCNKFKMRKVKQ